MNISSRDDQVFLKRLTAIVEANLGNEQFGVNELAVAMKISRSQIHRKLKSISKQSVSQFIREVRLKKAKALLEQGNDTVSEIAYKVGFGSPSYFIKSFREYYGFAPGEYVKYADHLPEKNNFLNNKEEIKGIHGKGFKFVFIPILILVSVIIGVYIVFFGKAEAPVLPAEKSIAILPLNYIKEDQEVQFLAEGIVEDILNRLSQVTALTVKSKNSSEIYRNTLKTTPEIAKELGVSYLVEGTILKEGDKVRIYIQLLDARADKHIWSQQYDRDLSGIFTFISDVSNQIAVEMETALSERETEQIEKFYTLNTEAYLLYQKGRYFWHLRGEENLKLSIRYFNQALELDSTYALAFAGLADVYMILPFYTSFPNSEANNKTIKYANKALSIDGNLDEPHVAIATAETFFNWNWGIAEKEFKKALELNPNNADAYQFYAEYLHKLDKLEEARVYANKAIELDPNAWMKYYVSTWLYYDEGKFEESLKASEKMLEFDENLQLAYSHRFRSYFRLKEYDMAFNEYLKRIELLLHDTEYAILINDIFKLDGITGVIQNEIDRLSEQSEDIDHRSIAINYGLLNNKDSALVHLERAFKRNHGIGIIDIKVHYDFKYLHGDPSFNALLEKMNLPID